MYFECGHLSANILALLQWSFGVTCWEVFSGGHIPYPAISPFNMVTLLESGYRLDKPKNAAVSNEM